MAALVAAVLAAVSACLYALGPAQREQTEYSWAPDPHVPGGLERNLILVAGTPETLSVTVPCSAEVAPWVLSTAPDDAGLTTVVSSTSIRISLARHLLADLAWAPGEAAACPARLDVGGGTWQLAYADGTVIGKGPTEPPRVTQLSAHGPPGLLSELRVDLLTQSHGSRPSPWQWLTGVAAIVLAVAASSIAMKAEGGRLPGRRRIARLLRVTFQRVYVTDTIVLGFIALWVFVSPAFFDDGWLVAEHRVFPELGAFSDYYTATAVPPPFGYWRDWIAHFWTVWLRAPFKLRIPIALGLAAMWLTARWALSVAAPLAARHRLARVGLATGFVTGVAAWLMTMRWEPAVALLSLVVLASAATFVKSRKLLPLAVGGLACVMSATVHPAGIVALAPLMVIVPQVMQWVTGSRWRLSRFATLVLSIGAVGVVLFFLDSDLGLKQVSIAAFRVDNASLTWVDEIQRYRYLSVWPYGTGPRRLSVVLILLAIVFFLVRRRPRGLPESTLPGWSLLFGVLLLFLTPSKWPWHFGGLVGLMAVALAIEIVSISNARLRWEWPRVLVAAAMTVLGGAATWKVYGVWKDSAWNYEDLQTLRWNSALPHLSPVWIWAALLATSVACVSVGRLLRGKRPGESAIGGGIAWFVPLVAAITIVASTSVLVADAVATQGWTFTKQNLRAALGRGGCGLADQTVILVEDSVQGLDEMSQIGSNDEADRMADERGFPAGDGFRPGWYYHTTGVAPLEVTGLDTFGSRPPGEVAGAAAGQLRSFRSEWYRIPKGTERITVLVAGEGSGVLRLGVQFANTRSGTLSPRRPVLVHMGSRSKTWRPLQITVPPRVTAVRLLAVDGIDGPAGWLAITEPALATTTTLGAELRRTEAVTLVDPSLIFYFPCARQPSIAHGTVEIPEFMVGTIPDWWDGCVFAPLLQLDYLDVTVGQDQVTVLRRW